MRFKITKKEKEEKVLLGRKGPNPGDEMKTIRFAWLPTIVEGHYVWLETYMRIMRWEETNGLSFNGVMSRKWVIKEPKLRNSNPKTFFRVMRDFLEV